MIVLPTKALQLLHNKFQ